MPTPGECCGCRKAPVQRYRFNLVLEDLHQRKPMTQLLCWTCTTDLVGRLRGQSVERTPQPELDDLHTVTGTPRTLHWEESGAVA
jgi:hypothetical protein